MTSITPQIQRHHVDNFTGINQSTADKTFEAALPNLITVTGSHIEEIEASVTDPYYFRNMLYLCRLSDGRDITAVVLQSPTDYSDVAKGLYRYAATQDNSPFPHLLAAHENVMLFDDSLRTGEATPLRPNGYDYLSETWERDPGSFQAAFEQIAREHARIIARANEISLSYIRENGIDNAQSLIDFDQKTYPANGFYNPLKNGEQIETLVVDPRHKEILSCAHRQHQSILNRIDATYPSIPNIGMVHPGNLVMPFNGRAALQAGMEPAIGPAAHTYRHFTTYHPMVDFLQGNSDAQKQALLDLDITKALDIIGEIDKSVNVADIAALQFLNATTLLIRQYMSNTEKTLTEEEQLKTTHIQEMLASRAEQIAPFAGLA